MTDKCIENLPDEVFLQIFEMLDGKTLKNCCLVNNRWNEIIGSSPSTMKKFVLRITSKDLDPYYKLKREFYNVSFELNHEDLSTYCYETEQILNLYGAKIRQLKFKKVILPCLESILKFTPLLEYLELNQVLMMKQEKPISLPNLRHLKIEDCCDRIFSAIIGVKHLLSLEIINYENRSMVMSFLQQHPFLQSFSIGFRILENFFQNEDVLSVPFRLKKLEFAGFPIQTVAYEVCLKKFLKLHAPSLTNLRLPHNVNNEICQIVFTQVPNLKSLSFNVESLPTEKSFYCCMSPLEQVTTLKLVGKFPKHEVAKLFIVYFPNVCTLDLKHLKCSIWSMKFLNKISESQKKIQHLMIQNFFKGVPPNLKFKHLKSLFVFNTQNFGLWKNFVLAHSSTIEEIIVDKIHEEGKLKPKDIEDIHELPKLQKLSFRSDKKTIEEVWAILKVHFKPLREINLRILSPKSLNLSIDKKIIFPNETQFWWPEKCDKFIYEE